MSIHPTQIEQIRPSQDIEDDEIDFRHYWRAIYKHKFGIVSFVVAISLLALPVLFSLVPIYKGSTTLLIESQAGNVVSIEEVYGLDGSSREYYSTQYEILRSRSLATRVVDKMNLWENPDFFLKKKPLLGFALKDLLPESWSEEVVEPSFEARRERAISSFMHGLEIVPVKQSQLVKVNFNSHNPRLAVEISRIVSEEYIDSDLESRLQLTQKASEWLTKRLDSLKRQLQESESQLQRFKEQEKLVDVQGVKGLSSKRLEALTDNLVEARQRYAEAEALYKQVKRAKQQGMSRLDSLPAILNHSQVQTYKRDVAEVQRKISELGKRYGPKHPKMIQMQAELKDARSSLYRQIQNVVNSVEREYEVARSNKDNLHREFEEAKKDSRGIDKKNYQLDVLQREVDANRSLYDLFLKRLKETSETIGIESANARILDPAIIPTTPFKPNKTRMLTMVIMLSALFAIAIALLLEKLDNTIKGSADVEEKLGLPVLGLLPKLKTKGKKDRSPLRAFHEDDQTVFAEAVRTIRTGVLLSDIDHEHKIMVVTSSVPGEGKSTVAMNIAHALSHMSKVLLIDADMRRPSIAEAGELGLHPKGLSQYAAGTAKISEAVYEIGGSNLRVMPAGIIPPNPLELISSKKFELALESLSKAFDHIVIDSAPTLAVSDALVLSRYADAMVYVVRADSTPSPAVQSGVKRLRQVNAPLSGAVVNMLATSKGGKYSYGAYGYQGDYYSDYTYSKN